MRDSIFDKDAVKWEGRKGREANEETRHACVFRYSIGHGWDVLAKRGGVVMESGERLQAGRNFSI